MGRSTTRRRIIDPAILSGSLSIRLAGLGALWVATCVLLVPQDLNLTDGGYILAYADRIGEGQIPHADFIATQPAGSAYLHLIDLALPLPLFAVSRAIAIAELIAAGAFFAMLVTGRRFRDLPPAALLGAGAAALICLHVFPPMAWHTIDGVFLCTLGFLLVERGLAADRRNLLLAGAGVLGAVALVKQSFGPAPVLGLLRIAWALLPAREWRRLGEAAAAMAAPGALYVLAVALAGGLDEMVEDLTGPRGVYGRDLWNALDADAGTFLAIMLLGAGALVIVQAARVRASWLSLLARLGLTALVLRVVLSGDLQFGTTWHFKLLWLAAAVLVASSILRRALDWPGVVAVGIGWMVSLSYGAARPAFAGGILALYVVARAWEGFEPPAWLPRPRLAVSLAAAAAAVAVAVQFWDVRHDTFYLPQRPTDILEVGLGGHDASLRGIETDTTTAAYLAAVKNCVERYPADRQAVLPDDGVSSVAFDLDNPFPLDWLWPDVYGDSRQRLVDAAERLGREGRYLVLFQIVSTAPIAAVPPQPLPQAQPGQEPPPFPYDAALTPQIVGPLDGERVYCGPFVGIYEPREAAASPAGARSTAAR